MLFIPEVQEEVHALPLDESSQIGSQLWEDNSSHASETSSTVGNRSDPTNGRMGHQLDVHMMSVLLSLGDVSEDVEPEAKRRRELIPRLKQEGAGRKAADANGD